MISPMRLSLIASGLSAELGGDDVSFQSVSTDTRSLCRGDLFVAIRGANFDGNEFVREAGNKGACAAIVDRYTPVNMPQLLVEDTTIALGKLGKMNRLKSTATIIGVTGSQGKTTVKEMIGAILKQCGETLITRGNLNNQLGVPLTLLNLEERHRFGVIEMGADRPGEIAYSAGLVAPNIALITNAARAHIEGFGSLEGVAQGKGEIIDGLLRAGTMVLNADDRFFEVWQKRASRRNIVSFSLSDKTADYFASDVVREKDNSLGFTLHTKQGSGAVRLKLLGTHNVGNAVAAAAVAMEAGASLMDITTGLADVQPVNGRMNLLSGSNGGRVIDDSYNASPDSLRVAIDTLAQYEGRRVLILGDMAELGQAGLEAYQEAAAYAQSAGIEELWTIGDASHQCSDEFGSGGQHFSSKEAVIDKARELLAPGVTLLVKGSRSAGVDAVVDALIAHEETRRYEAK